MLAVASRSIRGKLMLAVIATTFIALFITAVVLVIYDLRTYRQTWVNDLEAQAEILGRASGAALDFNDPEAAAQNLELLRVRPRIAAGALYDADGTLFAAYAGDSIAEAGFPEHPEPDGYRIAGNRIILFKRITDGERLIGTIYLSARYETLERLRTYLVIVGGVLIASLLVAVLLSYWLQASVTKPILMLSDVAHQVKERRDFSLRVAKTTDDELGYLVDTFNDMLIEVGKRAEALETANRTLEHEMAIRQDAERALLAADQRKDEFLATLAHELRNPHAPLRNALEILRVQGHDPRASSLARDIMDRQLRQMVRLVDDLLDVSRITTGKLSLKPESADLRMVVQSALDAAAPFIDARHLELSVSLPGAPVQIWADATRLAQVFLNLLHNASKFTEPGGRLGLTATTEGQWLVVSVTDTGIGIPAEMLPMIFDMFAQLDRSLERQHAGLGVGLSLARRLVELHGGTLVAFSEGQGRGSRFVIRAPVVIESPAAVGDRDGAPVPSRAGLSRRILLADDNADFITSFSLILRAMGHEVQLAHDGQEALDIAAWFRPEVAFLDIGLPRINGYELAGRLRALDSAEALLLIAVTGWGQDHDKQRSREAGFDHHMVKPVASEDVRAILMSG